MPDSYEASEMLRAFQAARAAKMEGPSRMFYVDLKLAEIRRYGQSVRDMLGDALNDEAAA